LVFGVCMKAWIFVLLINEEVDEQVSKQSNVNWHR